MVYLASDMTLEPTTTDQTGQHKRHYDVHSAVSQIHSGDCRVRVLCGQRRNPVAGSELYVQSRVVQHGCVGVEGPRNGSAVALTVAKHGFWAVTGVLAEWRKQQKLGVA